MIAALNNFILPDFGIGTKYLCIEKKVKVMSFVHLHVHTEYSTDGLSNIRRLFEKAAKLGMSKMYSRYSAAVRPFSRPDRGMARAELGQQTASGISFTGV